MMLRARPRRLPLRLVGLLLAAALVSSCAGRAGIVGTGTLPPPDGTQLGQAFMDKIQAARRAMPLPPLPRDPAVDQLALKAVEILSAGLPDGVSVFDHLDAVARLPAELTYDVGFESRTPGLDDRTRAAGRRAQGIQVDELLYAADPALDGLGWAGSGPWYVVVLRARRLTPTDGPALQAAIERGVQHERPNLRAEPPLGMLAAQAVADGQLGPLDVAQFGRAGGVPVSVLDRLDEAGLPSVALVSRLHDRGREVLGEPWLRGVGVATKVTDGGTVLLVVLATGDTDRPALDKELHDAEPKATELVNQARAEASLPPVSLDAALVEAAKRWLAEASKRGCFVGFVDDPGCPGAPPEGGDWTRARYDTWRGPDAAYSWYLVPAIYGDELLKRFGAAATIAPDGMVWSTVVFAK